MIGRQVLPEGSSYASVGDIVQRTTKKGSLIRVVDCSIESRLLCCKKTLTPPFKTVGLGRLPMKAYWMLDEVEPINEVESLAPAPEVVFCSSLKFGLALAAQLSMVLTPAFVLVLLNRGLFLSASTSYPLAGCSSALPASVSLDVLMFLFDSLCLFKTYA